MSSESKVFHRKRMAIVWATLVVLGGLAFFWGEAFQLPKNDEPSEAAVERAEENAESLQETPAIPSNKYAVLIGVDLYETDKSLALKYSVSDIMKIRDELLNIGFEAKNIELLTSSSVGEGASTSESPTKMKIEYRIKSVLEKAQKGDLVFIAFSGHGARSADGKDSFLIPADAIRDAYEETSVSFNWLKERLDESAATFKWVLIDACRNLPATSGGKTFGLLEKFTVDAPPTGVAFFRSSSNKQISYESAEFGMGAYTYFFVQGLKGEADSNGDGMVTLAELGEYAKTQTTEWSGGEQTPDHGDLNLGFDAESFAVRFIGGISFDDWQKAEKLRVEASKLKNAGNLEVAMEKIDAAKSINGSGRKIQEDRDALATTLIERSLAAIEKALEEENFDAAKAEVEKIREIDQKYPALEELEKKINDARNTISPEDSLAEAVKRCEDGTITLKRGVYELNETLEITGSPTIKSETGNAADVEIRCATDATLKIAGSPTLQGLSIRCAAPLTEEQKARKKKAAEFQESVERGQKTMEELEEALDDEEYYFAFVKAAIWIVGGKAQIVDCNVSCDSMVGVAAENAGTEPLLKNCVIHDCGECALYVGDKAAPNLQNCEIRDSKESGVVVDREGAGVFTKCDVYRNAHCGVSVAKKSTPHFVDCSIYENKLSGVAVEKESGGSFTNCDIYSNQTNVGVVQASNPTFTDCKIRNCANVGVYVMLGGLGKFVRCEITECMMGVNVGALSDPVFEDCQIHDGSDAGVCIGEGGLGVFTSCKIYDNVGMNVGVLALGDPKFTSCSIYFTEKNTDNLVEKSKRHWKARFLGLSGVYIGKEGLGKFDGCWIYDFADAGVWCEGNSTFNGCFIRDGDGIGVVVGEESRGEFAEVKIYGVGDSGVVVSGSANPTFRNCAISEGKKVGALIYEKGCGEFVDCSVFRNEAAGIGVRDSGNPTFRNCEISEGKKQGALILEEGCGEFVDCSFFNNEDCGIAIMGSGAPTVKNCKIYGNASVGVLTQNGGNPKVENCQIYDGKQTGIDVRQGGKGIFIGNTLTGNASGAWNIAADAGEIIRTDNTPNE